MPEEPGRRRGDAGSPPAGGTRDRVRRPGARRRRQHVRLHRPGQGGIRRDDPRAGRTQETRRDRPRRGRGLHGPEIWPGAFGRDSRGRRVPGARRARERARSGASRRRPADAAAVHGQAARDETLRRAGAEGALAPPRVCVSQSGRGVRQPLHVLHDSPDAGNAAQPNDRFAGRGGLVARSAGRRRAGAHLAGHDALRRGPRDGPRRPGPSRRSARGARRASRGSASSTRTPGLSTTRCST